MLNILVKAIIISAVPKAVEEIHKYFFKEDTLVIPEKNSEKITQSMYDFICQEYEDIMVKKVKTMPEQFKLTQKGFTEYLNYVLNINKSTSSYRNVYTNKVSRSNRPKGVKVIPRKIK